MAEYLIPEDFLDGTSRDFGHVSAPVEKYWTPEDFPGATHCVSATSKLSRTCVATMLSCHLLDVSIGLGVSY